MTVGPQQFWLGTSRVGQQVSFWIDGPLMALFPAGLDRHRLGPRRVWPPTTMRTFTQASQRLRFCCMAAQSLSVGGYETADHLADERADLLTAGMEAYTTSGIIGRPSLAAASKGKSAIASLVESFVHCMKILSDD
jgi:creatinine amidohydrolase